MTCLPTSVIVVAIVVVTVVVIVVVIVVVLVIVIVVVIVRRPNARLRRVLVVCPSFHRTHEAHAYTYIYIYIYIYIYVYTHMYVHTYIYIYIERERERFRCWVGRSSERSLRDAKLLAHGDMASSNECMYVCMYACVYVIVYVYIYTCIAVCIRYVYIYSHTYIYIYIYIYIERERIVYFVGGVRIVCDVLPSVVCKRNFTDSPLNNKHMVRPNSKISGFGLCQSGTARRSPSKGLCIY